MAHDKRNKEEVKKEGSTKKAITKEGEKEEKDTIQQINEDAETSGSTSTAPDQKKRNEEEIESQEDEMVTESIDIIQDASAKNKETAQQMDENVETSGAPPAAQDQEKDDQQEKESQEDEMVTESIDIIQDASAKKKNEAEKPEDSSLKAGEPSPKSPEVDKKNETENVQDSDKNAKSHENTSGSGKNDTSTNLSADNKEADKEEKDPQKISEDTSVKPDETSAKASEEDKKSAKTEEEDEDFAEAEADEEEDKNDDIDSALTEDSEDETAAERHNIPKKDYDKMSKEALIKEFRHLLNKHKIQAIKEHVDEIRAAFISQFEDEQEEAKERFLEDGGNIIDFRYYSPLKKDFNTLYFEYRDKRNNYFKTLKRDLNKNLEVRTALIEELKELKNEVGGEDSINTTFDKFRDIQERWRNAGNIPRDRYNLVWNNYHHHVENFYDFLHLNREFRDRDFKENLDKKMKLVEQAEELTKAQDINRAFKELQLLHKMWKEEIGPVAREYREEIWEKFSAATKKIHESRQEYFKNIDKVHEENLVKKQEVIRQIEEIAATEERSHGNWQKAMRKVEALRDEFFKIGKVPRKKNEETWKAFKKSTRTFNRNKNAFYKDRKKDQQENLSKKMELVNIAEDNKDNEDLEPTIELMKKIQADWKKIGHVPRRDSDKIWKRFKKACNHVFDRLHADKKEALEEEQANLTKKQELIDKAKAIELKGERDKDLETIKALSNEWKEIGRVPFSQKKIEKDFNKILDGMFKKLDLGRKETEMIKYDNRMAAMADRDDDRQIGKERYFISKKINEVKAEINQLENNLGFFQHVPDDNPMVKEVHKNIADHKKTLEIWKAKMKKIKTIS